ncbi:beta-1,6-N-acetylglucosaminyltransferase [Arcticibacter sp. MXS-1]|uniref:beta-1,6-N-acetylglucosaminyltransferase n=1 Tax=Arcticibacter sp. MXS-1 TaxID=3341726 RepID=UPI0035A99DD3
MKIAILILAHKNLQQLDRLLARLTSDFDVFLHLDKKWDVDEGFFKKYPNVYLTRRHEVTWASYQQIEAELELFTTVAGRDYDYHVLISGQDLPVKSNRYIRNFLEKNRQYSFIDYEALPRKAWQEDFEGGYTRLWYYYGFEFKKNAVGFVAKKSMAVLRYLQKLTGLKRKLLSLPYYGGWTWVNLNREALTYLVNYVRDNPQVLKSFRYTNCADEIWMQTILLTSDLPLRNSDLRYTDWTNCVANPRILTQSNLEELKHTDALFARKFDPAVDAGVIERVYEMTEEGTTEELSYFEALQ